MDLLPLFPYLNEPKIDKKTPKIAGKRLKNHFPDMLGGGKFQEIFCGV